MKKKKVSEPTSTSVKKMFATLLDAVGQCMVEITQMKMDLAEVRNDISGLKADVSELKQDVAELKSDVAELKTDVAELKSDVKDLKVRVTRIENTMVTKEVFEDRIAEMRAEFLRPVRQGDEKTCAVIDALHKKNIFTKPEAHKLIALPPLHVGA